MNYPKIVKIDKSIKENDYVKTYFFNYPENIHPGQFFMVWIPEIDEIPMSVSFINKNEKAITFKNVGEATNALFELKEGQKIGIRGPYGNGFEVIGKKILFIGGGTGIATIVPAIEKALQKNINCTVILGVKNKKELFFEKRIKQLCDDLLISTDDGSKGYKGLATNLAFEQLSKRNFDSIITCGPEIMMKKLFEKSNVKHFQASLERYMKCGIGICGQCCVGKGLRVCKEGPVFNEKTLKNIDDFGIFKRDAFGKKVYF
jgi:dihydroorotate dehydrogenase electron transfer subunit